MDTTKVFNDSSVDDITKDTGIIDERPVLSIKTEDRELIANFKRWITDSQAYWNSTKGYNLENVRARNERYYLGYQIDTSKLYNYQVPFVDNQIFVGTQAVMAYVTGRDPACEVTPQDKEVQSMVMAEDLETAINIHSERHSLARKVKVAAKNVYTKRVGIIKLYYDPDLDDIVPVALNPDNVILDKDCELGDEPKFVAEVCTSTVAGLIHRFPHREKAIVAALGRVRKTPKLMGQTIAYNEIWFTDESSDKPVECVAWYFRDIILDKIKNPNYLYDEDGVQIENFIDAPTKPYIFFNYLNDGSHLIDQTTPIEQAIPLQDILNKRGRQIVENADTANSLMIFKSGSIPDEQAENITRDPNQIIILDTEDNMPVQSAFGEITPHLLPNYVLQDKNDVKNSIHNILGTPSQFRGDDSQREVGTLGEAKMMQSQASGRQDEIVKEIEFSLNRYFRLLVQMMKVWYTDKHDFSTRDNDGNFMFVQLSRESMPDVANITVSQGSIMRIDKERRENIGMALAKMGLIDPYNLFKDLGLKDADKRYEALVKFKMAPDTLVADVKSEVADRDAYIDFSLIMNGQEAQPRDDITPDHIHAHRKQLMTDKFLYAKPEYQQAMLQHIEQEVIGLSQRAKLEAANEQGMLIDPSLPITPEPPEVPPPMPQPPMMPPQGMPPQGTPIPPMPDAGAMPPQGEAPIPQMPEGGAGIPDVGVLSGLMRA